MVVFARGASEEQWYSLGGGVRILKILLFLEHDN